MSFFNTPKQKVTNPVDDSQLEIKVLALMDSYQLQSVVNSRSDIDKMSFDLKGDYDSVWDICNANAGRLTERLFNLNYVLEYNIPV